jgi:hypothetical protein
MEMLKLNGYVDENGHLTLNLPIYLAKQKVEVIIQVPQEDVPSDANGWPMGYFEETYGILADHPIERGDQGTFEEREPIE